MRDRPRRLMVAGLETVIYPGAIVSAYLWGAGHVAVALALTLGVCAMIFVSVYYWPGMGAPPQ